MGCIQYQATTGAMAGAGPRAIASGSAKCQFYGQQQIQVRDDVDTSIFV